MFNYSIVLFRSSSAVSLRVCDWVTKKNYHSIGAAICFALLRFAVLYHRCVVISILYSFAADCKQVCEMRNMHTQTRLFMTYNRKTNIKRRIILTLQLVEHREWCFRFSLASNVREVSSAKKYSSTNILYQTKFVVDTRLKVVFPFYRFFEISSLNTWPADQWVVFLDFNLNYIENLLNGTNAMRDVNKCWLRWYNVDDSFPYHRLVK